MNGTLVRMFEATAVRRGSVFSIKEGRELAIEPGDRLTVAEDSYGNTYVDGIYVSPQWFEEISA